MTQEINAPTPAPGDHLTGPKETASLETEAEPLQEAMGPAPGSATCAGDTAVHGYDLGGRHIQ